MGGRRSSAGMGGALWVGLTLLWAARAQDADVRVETLRIGLHQELTLQVSSSVEYIVDIITSEAESVCPLRVWSALTSSSQDAAVLLTARRGHVADTWQLAAPHNDTQRTLCAAADTLSCEGESRARTWSVHVSTACEAVRVTLRVTAPAWRLADSASVAAAAARHHPLLLRYTWPDTRRTVRLLLHSGDSQCATVAVLNYTCPLPQTLTSLPPRGMRMTMLRAAAAIVKRSQYPSGFVVLVLVQESPEACGVHTEPRDEEWLWDAAVDVSRPVLVVAGHTHTRKELTVSVQPTLRGSQYAVASAVTLVVFLAGYVAVGTLVLVYRWQPCRRRLPCLGETPPLPPSHAHTSLDDSDDDIGSASEVEAVDGAGPFGLPGALSVARTARGGARRRARRAREYRRTLVLVAAFYALPVLQFVAAFQLLLNVSGQLDLCYYNYQCSHPVGGLADFNHVFSNAGYVLLGALFMVQVHVRRQAAGGQTGRRPAAGVPPRHGMMDALGAGLMVLGLLSAAYHVCPNGLNFQFDTAFMYVLSLLVLSVLHAGRHADVSWRAHGVFALLAALMACVVGGVLAPTPAFWAVWSSAHVIAATILSLKVYYLGQFRLQGWRAVMLADGGRPRYVARLVLLLAANIANWGFAVYGLVSQPSDFAGHLLSVLLANALLYLLGYLANKLAHGERPVGAAWALLGAAAVTWPAALYFFLWGASDWSVSPALSRERNHPCLLLGFYDAHDLWHLLSAAALYFTFSAMLVWDDDLADVPRDKIPVF